MKRLLWIIVIVTVAIPAGAQSLVDVAKKETDRRATISQPGKVITNSDLHPTDAPIPTSASETATAMPVTNAQGQDALTALRAVKSVLDGGANISEFKKYYLEAKIKVDALPTTADNAVLREISDLYRDADSLSIGARLRSLTSLDIRALKIKYAGDPHFMQFFSNVREDGFGPMATTNTRQIMAIHAETSAQVLMHEAGEKLKSLK